MLHARDRLGTTTSGSQDQPKQYPVQPLQSCCNEGSLAMASRGANDEDVLLTIEPLDVEQGVIEYNYSRCYRFAQSAHLIVGIVVGVVTFIVCLAIVARVSSIEQVGGAEDVIFAAVGDWGYKGLNHQTQVAEAMARWCLDNGCHYALSTGDNFYPNGVQSIDDDHWKASFEAVFNGTGLNRIPFLVSIGNHDYYGNVSAELDYHRLNPRWFLPSRYYTKSISRRDFTLRLIAIDTTPLVPSYQNSSSVNHEDYDAQDPQAQIDWLTNVLADSSSTTINIVFGHHPSVTPVNLHTEEPAMLPSIFERYRVPLVINGHAHNLQHVWYEGRNLPQYAITGAGGILVQPTDVSPVYCRNCSSWLNVQNGFLGVKVNQYRINLQFWSQSSVLLRETNIWLDQRAGGI